jgi:hypothetical protein
MNTRIVSIISKISTFYLFVVEFFVFVSSLKKKDWKEISKSEVEKCLNEIFVCAVCSFVEFSVSKNVHFDCEFCDSILILSLFFDSEFVAFSIFFLILENLVNENQSSMSFSFVRKRKSEIEKEIIFTFCFFVCVFINSSIENLFVLVFFVFVLNFSISFVWSSAFLSSEKCEFVQKEKKRFLNKKFIIKSDVSNLCETSNSNLSSLNKSCVEIIEIEKEKEKKKSSFCFEFFVIDFLLNFRQNLRKKNSKKKEKEPMCSSKSSINRKRVD